MSDVVLLVMSGGARASALERLVAEAREAAVQDTVERALTAPAIGRIVVATDSQVLADRLKGLPVEVDLDAPGEPFHFGRRLAGCIERHQMRRVLYMGGGSGVLLTGEELDGIARLVAGPEPRLVVNNFFSVDFAAWTPADCLVGLPLPDRDNALGWLLGQDPVRRGGILPTIALEKRAATQFDIDTPLDLLLVRSHSAVGPHLRRYLAQMNLDAPHLERAWPCLADKQAEVVFAGRIAAETWAFLERKTACRTRVFAEERGMRADGRLARGAVCSLLGLLMAEIGVKEGFKALAYLGDAAFVDSRVLWAHFGRWPAPQERYLSDLGRADEIEDEWLREFTLAAFRAPIPIVLGGHSLVSGGLYALLESKGLAETPSGFANAPS